MVLFRPFLFGTFLAGAICALTAISCKSGSSKQAGSPAAAGAPTPDRCATAVSIAAFLEGCIKSESAVGCSGRLVGRCGCDDPWFQDQSDSAQKGPRFGCTVTASNGRKVQITVVAGVDKDPSGAANRIEVSFQNAAGTGFENMLDIEAHKIKEGDAADCNGCHSKTDGTWAFFKVGSDEMGTPKVPPTFSAEACTQIAALAPKDCKSKAPASPKACESWASVFDMCMHANSPILDLSNPSPSPTPSSTSTSPTTGS